MSRYAVTISLAFIVALNSYSQDLIYQNSDISSSVWPISGSNSVQDDLADGYGPRLLSGSYDFHRGIDIPQPTGTGVHVPLAGEVVRVRPYVDSGVDSTTSLRRFGNFVVIAHDSLTDANGVKRARQTAYLHLDTIWVTEGQSVSIGDTVGLVGNSGENINTEHLHFEYYVDRDDGLINKENSRNPFRILNYSIAPAITDLTVIHSDSLKLTIGQDDFSIGLTRIRLETDTGVDKIIDFETREGIDINNEDDNTYGNTLISPENFTVSSDSFFMSITYHSALNGGDSWYNITNATVTLYNSRDDSTKHYYPAAALPVELVSFTATQLDEAVLLEWQTATEVNNYGFEVEKQQSEHGTQNTEWLKIRFVQGHGNSNSPKNYEFIDTLNLSLNPVLKYRLKQLDTDGSYEYYGTIAEVSYIITDIKDDPSTDGLPTEYALKQNYPNPFNPSTTIQYSIPTPPRPSPYQGEGIREGLFVTLKVYDTLGNEVSQLVNKHETPGIYEVKFDGGNLAGGVYFYRLQTGDLIQTKKMLLLK